MKKIINVFGWIFGGLGICFGLAAIAYQIYLEPLWAIAWPLIILLFGWGIAFVIVKLIDKIT